MILSTIFSISAPSIVFGATTVTKCSTPASFNFCKFSAVFLSLSINTNFSPLISNAALSKFVPSYTLNLDISTYCPASSAVCVDVALNDCTLSTPVLAFVTTKLIPSNFNWSVPPVLLSTATVPAVVKSTLKFSFIVGFFFNSASIAAVNLA